MTPTIHEIRESDSEAFLFHLREPDSQTKFMMYEPGERTGTPLEERARISAILQHENQTILVAEHETGVSGGAAQRRASPVGRHGGARLRWGGSAASCKPAS
jgi:hypothetical protein